MGKKERVTSTVTSAAITLKVRMEDREMATKRHNFSWSLQTDDDDHPFTPSA
jgi:hypothetical protein